MEIIPKRFLFLFAVICLAIVHGGCFVARPIVGASIDLEQLKASRESAVLALRVEQAEALERRLTNRRLFDDSDARVCVSQDAINKAAARLDSTEGRLDSVTTYRIRRTRIKLYNGSAVASVSLLAHSEEYNIDVDLAMDCLLTFSIKADRLSASFAPFNISPDVSASGLKALAAPMIRDIITMKISTTAIPPVELPIDLSQDTIIPALQASVRSGLAMEISMPRRVLRSSFRITDVLVLEGRVLVLLALGKAAVY